MRMYEIIYKKREGIALTKDEINFFVKEYTAGNIPDYQMAALLMAIFFQKMNKEETFYLTQAMLQSGETIDLSQVEGVKVDKHSTGGVGDKTTLVVGPLVATCGVPVAKMSGRGLGHTGGTLDKLESIEGLNVEMSIEKFIHTVNHTKLSIIGQSVDLAPADKKIYALRDVTATVDNIALIASSIMSKKLAVGSNAIVLDVKIGSGAFMKDIEKGIELAQEMVDLGTTANRETIALLTNMDQPLGYAVGNALEVKEAINTLNNRGPEDLKQLCVQLASYMILLAKRVKTIEEAVEMVNEKLESGEALKKFKEFVRAQGGDTTIIDDTSKLPHAKYIKEVKLNSSGYVKSMKTDEIGLAALTLGAGREKKDSPIDLAAGLVIHKKIGDKVSSGDTIATLYTNKEASIDQASHMITQSIVLSDSAVNKPKLIYAIVTKNNTKIL